MLKLNSFFQYPHYQWALESFSEFARQSDWRISTRAHLYSLAAQTRSMNYDELQRRESFNELYNVLKRNWKVGRAGVLMESDALFDHLNARCRQCNATSGLTAIRLYREPGIQPVVKRCLNDMKSIKTALEYPQMAASKFLHFWNPCLFPIWDSEVISQKVLIKVFSDECKAACEDQGSRFRDGSENFLLAYTWWAGKLIAEANENLMDYFSGWFIDHTGGTALTEFSKKDILIYYATAFEYIAIGAARLEKPELF